MPNPFQIPQLNLRALVSGFVFCLSFGLGHGQDNQKFDKLTDLAEGYIGNDPVALDSIASILLSGAIEEGNLKYQIHAHNYDGISSAMMNDLGPALQAFQSAWKIASEISEVELQVNALTNMAGVYKFAGQPDKAEERLERAISILTDPESKQTKANTLLALGILQEERGKLKAASENIAKAMHIFDEAENTSLYLSCVERLGGLLQDMGNKEGALSLYQFALKGRGVADQDGMSIPLYRSIGQIHLSSRRYEDARLNLTHALALADSLNYKLMLDSTLVKLIRVSAATGDAAAINGYTQRLLLYHKDQESKSVNETLASLESEYELNEQKLINRALQAESEQARLQIENNKLQMQGFIAVIVLLLVIVLITIALFSRIRQFNKQLEIKVEEKTKEVRERNNALKETSFKLAHELRSGVSTLLGAKQLLDEAGIPEGLDKDLYDAIGDSTEKLDQTIKTMIKNLDEFE